GNLDLVLTWQPEAWLDRDLGTFFLYGLANHGGRISADVGDAQVVDNIEAPDAVRLFEAWWQKSLFDDRASILLGLYDVNSEFYVVESAEFFIHSSFGIGAALGTSGVNGPSIFPSTSLGVRFKAEPVTGYELQAAVLDGVPGDPDDLQATRIELGADDGVLALVEIARRWGHRPLAPSEKILRAPQRRRVGRAGPDMPYLLRVAVGAWLYTTRLPHLSRTEADGTPALRRGHPGLYLTAELDASRLDPLDSRGLAGFLQLGFADGDVGQFAGYAGGGFKYTGLLPTRPDDELGVAVAAAFNGRAFEEASQRRGDSPSEAEIAIEGTYRARLAPWLSIQGDLQYVIDPGGVGSRDDALVLGLRFALSL
ncbi:MAG TPA: carbohydrate porin, partial [Myxococcota bacterium]|nr:carbohydrate porin [Myxococcota bacterium]